MFVLLFSGLDTFHAQVKMRMICRTFAIHTLPCLMEQRKRYVSTMVGTNLNAPATCCYDVLMEQYFVKWLCKS